MSKQILASLLCGIALVYNVLKASGTGKSKLQVVADSAADLCKKADTTFEHACSLAGVNTEFDDEETAKAVSSGKDHAYNALCQAGLGRPTLAKVEAIVVSGPAAKGAAQNPDEDQQADTPVSELPADLPGREVLIKAGFESVDQILSHEDLTKVDGIGAATVEKIKAFFDPPSE